MTPRERAALMRQSADILIRVADDSLHGDSCGESFLAWMSGRSGALIQAASTLASSAAFCAEQYAKEHADAELREAVR